MITIVILVYWLTCLTRQSPEEYREMREELKGDWL